MADAIYSFRNTSGFVTDATGTYALNTESYPTTRDGYTFGWSAGVDGSDRSGADRDNTVTDKRLAGINYSVNSATQSKFRVDLPAAGDYTVRLAIGDTAFDQSGQHQIFTVYDNVTSKLVIDKLTGPAQDHYYDATGVDRTEAAWPASNLPSAALTFASTIFNLYVGDTVNSGTCVLAHMQIAAAAGAPPDTSLIGQILM